MGHSPKKSANNSYCRRDSGWKSNYSRCEIAETLVIDEVPFTTFTIVTTQATDLVVDGDDVVVTIAVCSADAGCTDVFQRYTLGPNGVERLN